MRPNGCGFVIPLAVAVLMVLAGCTSVGGPAAEPTTKNDCQEVSYDRKPLPEQPPELTADSAASFAVAHANATTWNESAASADNSLHVSVEAETVNQTDTGYVVAVSGGGSYVTCRGAPAVADFFVRANYFVNETLVVRLDTPENETTNPLTNGGDVVAKWTE